MYVLRPLFGFAPGIPTALKVNKSFRDLLTLLSLFLFLIKAIDSSVSLSFGKKTGFFSSFGF
jgi:hypothetical protein